jgi:hypothetical protein
MDGDSEVNMEEDLVDYSEEGEKAFQRSIFKTRDELVEVRKGSKAFYDHYAIDDSLDLAKGKPNTKIDNPIKVMVSILNNVKIDRMPVQESPKANEF